MASRYDGPDEPDDQDDCSICPDCGARQDEPCEPSCQYAEHADADAEELNA